MEALPLVFSSGWASGINAYLVVLVLGISDRLHNVEEIPDSLGRWDVLAAAGFLFAMEFVADKIPYIDSTWDAISTAIRPTAGAVIGVLMAGDATTLEQAVLGVVGGGTALLSHLVKASTRLAVNSSPEPASNVAVSVGGGPRGADGGVVRGRPPPRRSRDRGGAARRRAGGGLHGRPDGPPRLATLEGARRDTRAGPRPLRRTAGSRTSGRHRREVA